MQRRRMSSQLAVALVLAQGITSCSDAAAPPPESGTTPEAEVGAPAFLRITERPIDFHALRESRRPSVALLDSAGNLVGGTTVVEWQSADSSVIAAGSFIRSEGLGTALLTATHGALTDTVTGVVTQVPAIMGVPWFVMIRTGDTLRIEPTIRDNNNQLIADPVVRWESSNPAVATVTTAGLVTGVAIGIAEVTARSGNIFGAVEVRVVLPGDFFFLTVRDAAPGGETTTSWTFPDYGSSYPGVPFAEVTEVLVEPPQVTAMVFAGSLRGAFAIRDIREDFRTGAYQLGAGPVTPDLFGDPGNSPPASLPWASLHWGGTCPTIYFRSIDGELTVDTVRAPARPLPTESDGLVTGRFTMRAERMDRWVSYDGCDSVGLLPACICHVGEWSSRREVRLSGEFRTPYGHRIR
jgi:hypothetical protein